MAGNLYSTKRFTPASVKIAPMPPAGISDVQPGLRFLMSDEARAEGEAFRQHLNRICWTLRPEGKPRWAEKCLIAILPDRFPRFHRADQVLGGLVSDALRNVAARPDIPRIWPWIPGCVAEGRPNKLGAICEAVRNWRRSIQVDHEEERGDRIWKAADAVISRPSYARHWTDRDVSDDRADKEAGLLTPACDLGLQPTGEIVDEMPF